MAQKNPCESYTAVWKWGAALSCLVFSGWQPALAQVSIGIDAPGITQSAVCTAGGILYFTNGESDCGGGIDFISPSELRIGQVNTGTRFATNGTATFNAATTTFNGGIFSTNIYNGGIVETGRLQVFNGATVDSLSVTNRTTLNIAQAGELSVTNRASVGSLDVVNNTLLRGTLTVNQLATFNAGATIGGSTNVDALNVAGGLVVAPGATLDMGGNRVTNIGAPVAATDAANRAYVDANVATTNAGVGAVDQRVTTLDARVTTVTTAQNVRIDTVEAVNLVQDVELNSLQSAVAGQGAQIGAAQQLGALQGAQISQLQSGQAALFDLAAHARRDIGKANEGVAMALAMESPALPAGTSFALSGGVGYYQRRTAATTAITARIGRNASASTGIGVGLNTGEVGARGGFQVAW